MGFQIFVSLSQKLPKKFHNHDVEKVKKFQRSNARRFKLFRKKPLSLKPDVVNIRHFKLGLFELTEFIV